MREKFTMNRFELINVVGVQTRILKNFGIEYALQNGQYLKPHYEIEKPLECLKICKPPHDDNLDSCVYSSNTFNLSMVLFEEVSSKYPYESYARITMELAYRTGTDPKYIRWLLYQLFGSYHNPNDYGLLGENGMILSPKLIIYGVIDTPTYYWKPRKQSRVEKLLDDSMIV